MLLEYYPEVLNLTPVEKLIFVRELWHDLAGHPAEMPVSREIIEDLDKRMELVCRSLTNHTLDVEQPRLVNGFEVMPANGRIVTPELIRKLHEESEES